MICSELIDWFIGDISKITYNQSKNILVHYTKKLKSNDFSALVLTNIQIYVCKIDLFYLQNKECSECNAHINILKYHIFKFCVWLSDTAECKHKELSILILCSGNKTKHGIQFSNWIHNVSKIAWYLVQAQP